MSGLNINNSRLQFKFSTISGTTPTIAPSTDFTDGTWIDTDLYVGEFFLNAADNNMWVRTLTGIVPITSGTTTVDISAFVNKTGDTMSGNLYLPALSASTISGNTIYSNHFEGNFYGDGSNLTGITATVFTGGTISGPVTFTDTVDFCSGDVTIDSLSSCGDAIDIFTNLNVVGAITATTYYGDGSNLSGVASPQTLEETLVLGNETGNNNILIPNSYGIFNSTGVDASAGLTFDSDGTYLVASTGVTNDVGARAMLGVTKIGDATIQVENNVEFNMNRNGLGAGTFSVFGYTGFNGIEYGADYSTNFTNRSLVDKEYVDNSISSASTTGNYLPLSGGTMLDNAIIQFDNASQLKEGNYDFGGQGGISQICSVGYENNWQSGINHIFDNNGFIRESSHCFTTIPDNTFDSSLRFKVDSRWILDNGDIYVCSDASVGAAVWNLQSSFTGYTYITEDTVAETLVFSGANSIVTTVTGVDNTDTLRVDGDEIRLTALGPGGQTNYLTVNRDIIANYASLEDIANNYAYETLSPTQKNINIYDDTSAQSTYTLSQTSELTRIEDGSGGLSESNINASTAYLLNTGGEGVDTSVSVDQNYAEMKQVEGSSVTRLQVSNDGFYKSQFGSTGISKGVSKTNFTSAETTDATPLTLVWPLSDLEVGTTAVGIKATVTGINSTDDKAYLSELYAAVRMNAYAVTIFGGVDKLEKSEYTTATSTIDIDSLNAAIIVTGEVGETIRWSVKYELIYSA